MYNFSLGLVSVTDVPWNVPGIHDENLTLVNCDDVLLAKKYVSL